MRRADPQPTGAHVARVSSDDEGRLSTTYTDGTTPPPTLSMEEAAAKRARAMSIALRDTFFKRK